MTFIRKNIFATACALALCGGAMSDVLLVDRGLPTANLNNAASSLRSNVAWADSGQPPATSDYLMSMQKPG